ncbi:hypothetical protein tb265_03610 [Gemmatimonadetes bacterium T265]|nr:hypothetical protein tb265_03610 [Gemmatimonadetes bacterium T265]
MPVLVRLRPSFRPRVAAVAACAALCAAAPHAARAQAQTVPVAPPPAQLPYAQTLTASPLFIPLGTFSAEYETKLGVPGVTAAVAGTVNTTTQLYPRRDRWASARVMYYPGLVALQGFAFGVSLGAHRAERKYKESPSIRAHDGGATLGVLGTYNYLFGRDRRLLFGTGLGVKRVLKTVAANSPLSQVYVEGRFGLGIAF